MTMICKQLNPHSCRTYLIGLEDSSDIVLIDAVLDHVNDYMNLIKEKGYNLVKVIDTHTHADHISGGAALKDMTGCSYAMHENAPAKCPDFHLSDRLEWKLLDEIHVRVMATPGHTRDSISLIFPDRVFTGDALFLDSGGAGRDDLPGGDPGAHWESLQKLSALPEELIVYPAHDYRKREPSSLGQQKKTNPHLKPRSKEEFVHYLEDLILGPAEWMEDVLKANYACASDPGAAWIPADSPACEVKGTLDLGVNDIQVASITASAVRDKMVSDTPPLFIDVREPQELSEELGYIEGSTNIPIGSLAARLSELENNKDREIVTVCRSGARAHTAAQIMTKAGFSKASVLSGGMVAWNAQQTN